jgi:deoxyribodipyrimidine photo-lyase
MRHKGCRVRWSSPPVAYRPANFSKGARMATAPVVPQAAVPPVVLWLRNDLRLSDHRALAAAVATGAPVIPVYILDQAAAGAWPFGGASLWWLHNSLTALTADLAKAGSRLVLRKGETSAILAELCRQTKATTVFMSRAYEPWAASQEQTVKETLAKDGVALKRYAGALLFEPEALRTKAGDPFKVYTPFWRAATATAGPAQPTPAPRAIAAPAKWPKSDTLEAWALLPRKPDWATGLRDAWQPGSAGATKRLDTFLATALHGYSENRNRPDLTGTSRLSPHLHFGEISPAQCWHAAKAYAAAHPAKSAGLETFLKELVWREFSYHLLVHWPTLPHAPFRADFARFPWLTDDASLKAWQRGQTGYPIVDAGMRELWATGWMHNRVRMIVGSFLVKHLLLPWQAGEAWFWDTLVDADLASNSASWQWIAGSGADAAPYFRIFNPMTQGEKFDPDAAYVRRWVPELARLPNAVIHEPWSAPAEILAAAGVRLGSTYPHPIVDHAAARTRALAAFQSLKAL